MDLTHDDILNATMKLDEGQKVQEFTHVLPKDYSALEMRVLAAMLASKAEGGKAYDFVVHHRDGSATGYSIANGEMHSVTMRQDQSRIYGKEARIMIVDDVQHQTIDQMLRGQSKTQMVMALAREGAKLLEERQVMCTPKPKGKSLPWFHGKRRF